MSKMERNVLSTLALLICFSFAVHAQSCYVVIASFSQEARAKDFSESVSNVFAEASFRFDPQRKLYHVFVMQTDGMQQAQNYRAHLQKVAGFTNAWVISEVSGRDALPGEEHNGADGYVKLELYTGTTVLLSSTDNSYMSVSMNRGEAAKTVGNDAGQAFSLIAKTPNGHPLAGRVALLDSYGNRVSEFKTNEVVRLNGNNGKERMILVCDAPGYSTETKMLDLRNPAATPGVNVNNEGAWEITFDMSRVKGDKVELVYRGLFHHDASVVEPLGKESMDVLLSLLRANSGWRIVINSHTNPQPKRRIALATAEDIFDLSRAHFEEASDKQLTKERAQILHDYLVAGGVSKQRITAMGWGSLAKVADPAKGDAHFNDRVEVVLLMD